MHQECPVQPFLLMNVVTDKSKTAFKLIKDPKEICVTL